MLGLLASSFMTATRTQPWPGPTLPIAARRPRLAWLWAWFG